MKQQSVNPQNVSDGFGSSGDQPETSTMHRSAIPLAVPTGLIRSDQG